MPAPYSYDLRTKVIEALALGMGKTQVSQIFNISRNTINLWLKKREETGSYQAKEGDQRGYDSKITDLDEFRQFAQKHGSLTQKEMAEAWKEDLSGLAERVPAAAHYRQSLEKNWLYPKKKLTVIEREMKKKDNNLEKKSGKRKKSS